MAKISHFWPSLGFLPPQMHYTPSMPHLQKEKRKKILVLPQPLVIHQLSYKSFVFPIFSSVSLHNFPYSPAASCWVDWYPSSSNLSLAALPPLGSQSRPHCQLPHPRWSPCSRSYATGLPAPCCLEQLSRIYGWSGPFCLVWLAPSLECSHAASGWRYDWQFRCLGGSSQGLCGMPGKVNVSNTVVICSCWLWPNKIYTHIYLW